MNNQEIFDTVAHHLLTQGEQSLGGTVDGCAYRGDDGRKCAVGCLIPDELYSPHMEGKTIMGEEVYTVLQELGLMDGNKGKLLGDLQFLHDHDEQVPYSWEEDLLSIARGYQLDPTVVTTFPHPQTHE